MSHPMILYVGAGLTALWGLAHLIPTRSVVDGFGDISRDNRLILTMEWVTEGVALLWIGLLVAGVSLIDPTSPVSRIVYLACSAGLLVLAVVSLFTGFRVSFLPYKLCPLIFTVSALLILAGGLL